jgi:type II secretory pathway component PulJ
MKKASRGPGEKRKVAGYTILETMIFLTVSALLFISAMRLVGGHQGRTESRFALSADPRYLGYR